MQVMTAMINRDELDRQTFGEPEIRREIIQLFRDQAPVLLAALEGGAGQTRSETAHKLKGSALAMGAGPLATAAGRLEGEPDNASLLVEVRLLLDQTLQALVSILGE
jgi:HPt (histidine-containing phosphotransfer) domain-containing protein